RVHGRTDPEGLTESSSADTAGAEIGSDFDRVGDRHPDVAHFDVAERKRGERKRLLFNPAKDRIEDIASDRADAAVTFALQIRSFNNKVFVDINLTRDIDPGPKKKL